MYRPDHYRVEDFSLMHALMRAKPLVALVSGGAEGLCATHLPTALQRCSWNVNVAHLLC